MKILVECKKCGKIIKKEKKDIERTKNNFCSRSCSVSFNNSNNPKRTMNQERTLKDFKGDNYRTYKTRVNDNAKRIYLKSKRNMFCLKCGYDKHVEISHIKSVSSFSLDTKLKEVNNIKNLIALCPTHHWEFDNKILELEIPPEEFESSFSA